MDPPPLITCPPAAANYITTADISTRMVAYALALYGAVDDGVHERLDEAISNMCLFTFRDIIWCSIRRGGALERVVNAVTCSMLLGPKYIDVSVDPHDLVSTKSHKLRTYGTIRGCVVGRRRRRQELPVVTFDDDDNMHLNHDRKGLTCRMTTVRIVYVPDTSSQITYRECLFTNDQPTLPYAWCVPARLVSNTARGTIDYASLGRLLSFLCHTEPIVYALHDTRSKLIRNRHARMCGADPTTTTKTTTHPRSDLLFHVVIQSFLNYWLYVITGAGLESPLQLFATLWHRDSTLVRACFAADTPVNVSPHYFHVALHATHAIRNLYRMTPGDITVGREGGLPEMGQIVSGFACTKKTALFELGTVDDVVDVPSKSLLYTLNNNNASDASSCCCPNCLEQLSACSKKKRRWIFLSVPSRTLFVYILMYMTQHGYRCLNDGDRLPKTTRTREINYERQLEAFERAYFWTLNLDKTDTVLNHSDDRTLSTHVIPGVAGQIELSNSIFSNKVINVVADRNLYSHMHCQKRQFIQSRWRMTNPVATLTNFIRSNPHTSTCPFNVNFSGDGQTWTHVLRAFDTMTIACRGNPVRFLLPVFVTNANSTMYALGVENVGVVYNALKRTGRKLTRFPAVELILRIDATQNHLSFKLTPKNVCPRNRDAAVYAAYIHGRLSVNMQRNFATTLPHCQAAIWRVLKTTGGAVVDGAKNKLLALLERKHKRHLPRKWRLFLESLMEVCRLYMTDIERDKLAVELAKTVRWNP